MTQQVLIIMYVGENVGTSAHISLVNGMLICMPVWRKQSNKRLETIDNTRHLMLLETTTQPFYVRSQLYFCH